MTQTLALTDADRPARSRAWALAFGFWTLLALSYTVSGALSSISEGHDPTWIRWFAWNYTDFYLWMALTPLVARLGRYTAGRGWRRFMAVHIPASLLSSALQTLTMLAIFYALCGPGRMPAHSFADYLPMEFVYKFHEGLLVYWLMLVVLRGLETRRRLDGERLRNARLETQLAQSQLQALRMQLQPHFLFNTLHAISTLALSQPQQARTMIARLSDLLRLSLEERHAQHVPLARELQFLEHYLDIQQVRFQDRLCIEMDVATDTVHAQVPGMILQPLVENALRHGLLDRPHGGCLRIVARREGDVLYLGVEDDGSGLPPDGVHEGIGLGNTRARLGMLFGDAARLELRPGPRGGTCAELRLPFEVGAA